MLLTSLQTLQVNLRNCLYGGHAELCRLVPQWGNFDSWSFYWYVLALWAIFHTLFAFVWAYHARNLAYDADLQGSWRNALWLRFWLNMLRTLFFYTHFGFILAHIYVYITRVNHLELGGWIDPNEPYNYLFGDLSTRSWMDYLYDWFVNFFKRYVDFDYYQKKHDAYFEQRSVWAEAVARDLVQACEDDRHALRMRRWETMRQFRLSDERCRRLNLAVYYAMHKC